jgi:hypothetical protein
MDNLSNRHISHGSGLAHQAGFSNESAQETVDKTVVDRATNKLAVLRLVKTMKKKAGSLGPFSASTYEINVKGAGRFASRFGTIVMCVVCTSKDATTPPSRYGDRALPPSQSMPTPPSKGELTVITANNSAALDQLHQEATRSAVKMLEKVRST